MFSFTLAVALPKIQDCHPDQSQMKFFKELYAQVVPEGGENLNPPPHMANHTQNLNQKWALVSQMLVDLEQAGVKFDTDMSEYSQAHHTKIFKGCGKNNSKANGKIYKQIMNLLMTFGHQDPFTDRPPSFSFGSKDLALPHSHSICSAYQTPHSSWQRDRQQGLPMGSNKIGKTCIVCPAQLLHQTPLMEPQGSHSYLGLELEIPKDSTALSGVINPQNQNQGWMAGRPYSGIAAPQPCQPCNAPACCTPLIEMSRPRAFREELGATVNFAAESEAAQVTRTTAGVNSTLAEKKRKNPIIST